MQDEQGRTVVGRRPVLCAVIVLCGIAGAANAQSSDQQWHGAVTVYGYFPSIHGDTTFPNGNTGPTFTLDRHTILDSLEFAFMGRLHVQKGRWGGMADLFYANLGDSRSGTRDFTIPQVPIPVGVTANFDLDSKTTLLTLAGTYQLVATPGHDMRLLFGTRMYDASQQLDWQLSAPVVGYPQVTGRSSVDNTKWDAIVGLSGRVRFGPDARWILPWYLDVGTGESRFTGQAYLGIGYAFNWGEVHAGWRYIDYRFKSGSLVSSASFSGPAVGVTWRF